MAASQMSLTRRPLFAVLLIFSFLVCECEMTVGFADYNVLATKASINGPSSIAVDEDGNLFIVESIENKVRRVDAKTGFITIVAGNGNDRHSGDGGLATQASLSYPTSIAIDKNGNLFIDEIGNFVRRVDARTGIITTVAGNGHIGITGAGDGGLAINATFRGQFTLAVDESGNLFIADSLDHRVRRVDAHTGIITTVAGNGEGGFSGDGELATNARLRFPSGVAIDREGNLFISDYENNRIRRIDSRTRIITTVAGNGRNGSSGDGGLAIRATLYYPGDLTIDNKGNLIFVEGSTDRVRRVDGRTGIISTVAGNGEKGFSGDAGLASRARLNNPSGVAVDSKNNLFITEFVNNRVRRVNTQTGIITTVAGNGLPRRADVML